MLGYQSINQLLTSQQEIVMMNHGKFVLRNTLKNGYAQNFQSIGIAVTKDTRLCIINDVPLSYIKSLHEEGTKLKTDDPKIKMVSMLKYQN